MRYRMEISKKKKKIESRLVDQIHLTVTGQSCLNRLYSLSANLTGLYKIQPEIDFSFIVYE